MPIFTLRRATPLTEEEQSRLPPYCRVLSDGSDLVASAELDRGIGELLAFTVVLARAVPDARLIIEVPAVAVDIAGGAAAPVVSQAYVAPVPAEAPAQDANAPTQAAASAPVQTLPAPASAPLDVRGMDPWAALDSGDRALAERIFASGYELDMLGRDRTREMFNSTDPDTCALACRIVGYTNWKSFATSLRRVLDHGDVRVRRDAVTALGKLAGLVMLPAVEGLLNDPSPEVRAAAKGAADTINARPRPRDNFRVR